MDYFSKFLRSGNQFSPKPIQDNDATEFHKSWTSVKVHLNTPLLRHLSHVNIRIPFYVQTNDNF